MLPTMEGKKSKKSTSLGECWEQIYQEGKGRVEGSVGSFTTLLFQAYAGLKDEELKFLLRHGNIGRFYK